MRPPIPDITRSPSRKSSFEHPPDPRSAVPETFFLSRSSHDTGDVSPGDPRDSMYGVQSLDEAHQEASVAPSDSIHSVISEPHYQHDDLNDNGDAAGQRRSTLKPAPKLDTPLQPLSDPASSCPLTPLNLSIQAGSSSLPSSPKSASNNSLKPLDDISITDDLSSQAVASGEEDNEPGPALGHDSLSQLIMPSIRMPSRRPFTERGKAMGRLKLVLAGASGSGKTSLINSVVQACDDIVHIDPFFPPSPSHRRASHPQSRFGPRNTPPAISEFYASTKPYPSWWSDLEDSRVLRRRKSTGDVVLERNLCFVDTPAGPWSQDGYADAIIQYIQQQLVRAMTAPDSSVLDFQNMLAGNGGSQVDAVLYLISEDTLATDIECLRKLGDLTNIIPVISKADLLSPDQVSSLKSSYHKQAKRADIKTFHFSDASPAGNNEHSPLSPFAVSSARSNDEETMDASTLMSPDYVQPLVPSELGLLVDKLFDRDNVAWMRHSAAKKLAQHRVQPRQHIPATSASGISGLSATYTDSYYASTSPSYTLARITDHTQSEEQKAQIHLAKWAQDLQRSLQNERNRYTALARGERAIWLTEQLKESVMDGSLVSVSLPSQQGNIPPEKTPKSYSNPPGYFLQNPNPNPTTTHPNPTSNPPTNININILPPTDPLGLVTWTDNLRQRGWLIVRILGGVGVVGGFVVWVARCWVNGSSSTTTTTTTTESRGLGEWRGFGIGFWG